MKIKRRPNGVERDVRKTKYNDQMQQARVRGVEWQFTFEAWWALWEPYWAQRGRQRNELVMARKGDSGPYSPDNVRIITASANRRERRHLTGEETGHKLSKGCVARIRDMLAMGCVSKSIAAWFGVSKTMVYNIKAGRAWARS